MAGFLNVADHRRLVEALLDIQSLRNRRTRDLVISALEGELGQALPVARFDEDLFDMWQIVKTCCDYPGSMHALALSLDVMLGNHVAVTRFRALVDELFPEPLLRPGERHELHELLRAMYNGAPSDRRHAILPRLYQEAVGPLGPPLDRPIHGFETAVLLLEEATIGPDGVPPLMTFVLRLIPETEAALAEALIDWSRRLAARLGLEHTRLRDLHDSTVVQRIQDTRGAQHDEGVLPLAPGTAAEPATAADSLSGDNTAYLTVECRPDLAASGDYLVTAWLQYGSGPGAILHCDDDPQPLSGLPVLLEALLVHDHQVVHRRTDELVVEFVMPRNLLNYEVDQLKISLGGVQYRIGMEYPVVVRSLDRMQARIHHRKWQRKWRWLQQNADTAATCWITEPGQFGNEQLLTLLGEDSASCLALPFPPHAPDPAMADEHWVGLLAGTPVMIWSRKQRDPALFAEECRSLLEAGPVPLPSKVFALRRKAVLAEQATPHHLGLQLTLIFDDADRLPQPYAQLSAPA